jgi:DNA polymerase III delta prime subunit
MSLLRKARSGGAVRPAGSVAPSAPPAPSAPSAPAALFIDAHAPKASKDLAMHKKKVDEVRDWLQKADTCLQLGLPPTPRLLVLSGPPGTGKSTVLRVLADEMGFETCEWAEPRSVSWDDAAEPREEGERRADPRIARFSSFLRDSLRTLALAVAPAAGGDASGGSRRRLVVLDELAPLAGPSSADSSARDAQLALIRRALPSARFPLALILSSDASNTVHHVVESLRGADPTAHALVSEIKVNAVADTILTRALKDVCAKERLGLTPDDLASLVATANGDLRNALQTLQFQSAGQPRRATGRGAARSGAARSGAGTTALKRPRHDADDAAGGAAERDRFPDLFKTVNAILLRPSKRAKLLAAHMAEREEEEATERGAQEQRAPQSAALPAHGGSGSGSGSGSSGSSGGSGSGSGSSSSLTENSASLRPKATLTTIDSGFVPEAVIESSTLEEPSAAAFLHQNYLDCFGDVDELAEAAEALSDAHVLAEAQRRRPWQTALLPYVASLAARGVITPNRHPIPARFPAVRKPQLFQVERDALERKRKAAASFVSASELRRGISSGVGDAFGGVGGGGVLACGGMHSGHALTTELLPYLKLLATPRHVAEQHLALSKEQWQLMATLGTYTNGPPPPPHCLPPAAAAAAAVPLLPPPPSHGGATATAPGSAILDDIED